MKYYLIIFFTLIFNFSYAQLNPESKLGSWYIYCGKHQVSDKLSFNSGLQLWFYNTTSNYNLFLGLLGANYHISPKTYITLNYCYLDIESTKNIETKENRLCEQIGYKQQLFKIPIDHRLCIEQRFQNVLNSNYLNHRLRYRLGTKLDLNKTLFIRVSDEIFANFKNEVFNQNRFYSAFGIKLTKSNNIQFGYLNQRLNGVNLHRLQVGIYIKTRHFNS
jgi:hypothetical protein